MECADNNPGDEPPGLGISMDLGRDTGKLPIPPEHQTGGNWGFSTCPFPQLKTHFDNRIIRLNRFSQPTRLHNEDLGIARPRTANRFSWNGFVYFRLRSPQ